MSVDYGAAAQSLIERGFATIQDSGALMRQVRSAFLEGRNFFGESSRTKCAASTASKLEGYRPLGAEFSGTREQPDLCESFSVWGWNGDDPDVRAWATKHKLHQALWSVLPGYSAIANGVLESVRSRINAHGQAFDASQASYVQMNHYRPKAFEREFLQGVHEDGHVLSILTSTAPGLEICIDGQFTPAETTGSALLLLPGSILTLITGGRIAPLYHRVRNDHRTAVRQSLVYFTNPSILVPTVPWIENETNQGVDIRAIAVSCIGAR
jgi:isopenicillin N synthase-like dioxygenase